MGFYSPSQLVQDAKRHNVAALPPDINSSQWDHTLEDLENLEGSNHRLRLGLRIIRGFPKNAAERLCRHRPKTGYKSSAELRRLADLNQREMELLAGANAMPAFASNRHQAYWQLLDHEKPVELFSAVEAAEDNENYELEPCDQLPEPTEGQNLLADYASQGLTLKRHAAGPAQRARPFTVLPQRRTTQNCKSRHPRTSSRPGNRSSTPRLRLWRYFRDLGRRNRQRKRHRLAGNRPQATQTVNHCKAVTCERHSGKRGGDCSCRGRKAVRPGPPDTVASGQFQRFSLSIFPEFQGGNA